MVRLPCSEVLYGCQCEWMRCSFVDAGLRELDLSLKAKNKSFVVLPCDLFTTLLRWCKRVAPDAEAEMAAAKVSTLADGAADGFATMINLNNTHSCSAFACARSKAVHVFDSLGGRDLSVGHRHLGKRMKMLSGFLGFIDSKNPDGPNCVKQWSTKYHNQPDQADSYRCGPLAFHFLVIGLLGDVHPQGMDGEVARLALAFTICGEFSSRGGGDGGGAPK